MNNSACHIWNVQWKKNYICDVLAHNLDALDWLVWNESFLGKWTKLWSDFEYEASCLL